MLIFGHAGITLGAAVLLNRACTKSQDQPGANESRISSRNRGFGGIASWFTSLGNSIDIRLLLVGSLLPDIIDKPVGVFLFGDIFSSGRIFCHTLLFLILITIVGLYLYQRRKSTWLLVLSFGTFTHLILDRMWLSPRTLLWPLYGFSFEKADLSYWIQGILDELLTNPIICIPELVGLVIVGYFVWLLVHRGNLHAFIRNGQV